MKDAEKIAREIVTDCYYAPKFRLEGVIEEALRSAYSAGYAAAREQAAEVAEDTSGSMGEFVAHAIRAMEPPKTPDLP